MEVSHNRLGRAASHLTTRGYQLNVLLNIFNSDFYTVLCQQILLLISLKRFDFHFVHNNIYIVCYIIRLSVNKKPTIF